MERKICGTDKLRGRLCKEDDIEVVYVALEIPWIGIDHQRQENRQELAHSRKLSERIHCDRPSLELGASDHRLYF